MRSLAERIENWIVFLGIAVVGGYVGGLIGSYSVYLAMEAWRALVG